MTVKEVENILGTANEYSYDYEDDGDMTALTYRDKVNSKKDIDFDFTFFGGKLEDKDRFKVEI